MSFHSLSFIYLFLPAAALGFFAVRKISFTAAQLWIILASLAFYAIGDVAGLPVLTTSILVNFFLGKRLASMQDPHAPKRKNILILGISLNISFLAFFKYAHLIISPMGTWFFPLALSFYTFSQIGYLIEIYQGKISQPKFLDYLAYVSFFPKLIAGPIARPSEFLPQFSGTTYGQWNTERILQGLSLFFVGLFKKILIADQLALYTDKLFELADGQKAISFYDAWAGMMMYGMQLYFDFSGYTDMAIGVAIILGIMLPINFDAPYKSTSITEFWRRWHMSLSYFLRDYVYIPLGGSRKGVLRKYINLVIVMVLCGIWHGSSIGFLLWGTLHGIYLITHNVWSEIKKWLGRDPLKKSIAGSFAGWAITFAAVTFAWVLFRADSLDAAYHLFSSLITLPRKAPSYLEQLTFYLVILPPSSSLPPFQQAKSGFPIFLLLQER